jgi:PIN domain
MGSISYSSHSDSPPKDRNQSRTSPAAGLQRERGDLFDGFLNQCRWVEVFNAWRPSLPDEADNHLIELAVAAQADAIVTRNLRDVSRGELKFPSLRVLTPEQCLEVFPCPR